MLVMHRGDVREGMDVLGLDGTCVGTVGAVWLERDTEPSPHDLAGGMPASTDAGRDGHFLVLGGGDELVVPFEAIVILFPGQNLTIACTAEECRERYCAELGMRTQGNQETARRQ
jgi:hypothetical protein